MNLVSAKTTVEGASSLATFRSRTSSRAFTLLETVLVVGALAALGGVGYIAFSDIEQGASSSKIRSDVSSLNEAVTMYMASGGDLGGVKTPNQVLAKLKTEQTAAEAARSALPITGSLIDRRLVAEMQTVKEASTSQPRALWSETDHMFEVKNSGVVGVKRFKLDPSVSDAEIITEARGDNFYAFNGKTGWVWDTNAKEDGVDGTLELALVGTSPVERTAFPVAPETTSPPVINAAILADAEAPTVDTPGEVITAPATAEETQEPLLATDAATMDLAAATVDETQTVAAVGAVVTDPALTPEEALVEDLAASMELAAATAPDDLFGIGDLSSTLTDFADMLTSEGSGDFSTATLIDGSLTDTSTVDTAIGPSRLQRPVIDRPGGGYLMSDFPLEVQVINGADYERIGTVVFRRGWDAWQPYTGPITVQENDRLSVKVLTSDPEFYTDSYEVVESYFAAAHIFSGVTEGDYMDVEGGPDLVYSLTENDSFLSHGSPVTVIGDLKIDGGEANTLKFMLSQFSGVTAGVPFRIGDLLYSNGTTYDATDATSCTLHIEVVFTEPLAAKELKLPLELGNTVNSADADASADYVKLVAADLVYPLELDGRLYDMTIEFGEADAFGFSSPTQFYVYEGQTARVAVMATLTDKGPKPGGSMFGDWLESVIVDWLTERGYL